MEYVVYIMIYLVGIGLLVLATILLFSLQRRQEEFKAFGQMSNDKLFKSASPEGQIIESTKVVPYSAKTPQKYTEHTASDPETIGVARRQFLNRGIITMFGFGLTSFGASAIAFLYPGASTGFGGKINVGGLADIKAGIQAGNGFLYVPEGRMWVTEYPNTAIEKAQNSYGFFPQVQPGLQAGVTALYQTCPHLGCRVPECATSQWFECPCHGSQYNRVGEKKGGPAPRGMDRFPMEITSSGDLVVDTGTIIQGPPIGTNTTGQEAEGPNCIGAAEEHS